jgi:serine/threonine-protein kinase HipA
VNPKAVKLMQPGSALGGARPKDVVEIDKELWLAKFAKPGDQVNVAEG